MTAYRVKLPDNEIGIDADYYTTQGLHVRFFNNGRPDVCVDGFTNVEWVGELVNKCVLKKERLYERIFALETRVDRMQAVMDANNL